MSDSYGDFLDEDFNAADFLSAGAARAGIDLNERHGDDEIVGVKITRWRGLPEDKFTEAATTLREFVEWLVERYEISTGTIPNCWYRHPPLVEELSALRAAWDVSFDVDMDGGLGPIGWHERFALAIPRIKAFYGGGCARNGHQPPSAKPAAVDENDWTTWIGEGQ